VVERIEEKMKERPYMERRFPRPKEILEFGKKRSNLVNQG